MCSRYEIDAGGGDLDRRFALKRVPGDLPVGILRPADRVPVVTQGGAVRLLRWGFEADWSTRAIINARAETLAAKPTFRGALENRCLVPASAYFEWRQDGKRRLKNRIGPASGGLMAFAGLVSGDSVAIVTCAPAADIAHVHDRMPVVLAGEAAEAAWIDPALAFADVRKWLVPTPPGWLHADEETPPEAAEPDLFAE